MGEQDHSASALMAGLSRIEAKLDTLLDALADEGAEEGGEAVRVVTIDGQVFEVPAAPEGDPGLL